MIKLEVEDYCQSCHNFSPDVERPIKLEGFDGEVSYLGDTTIRCENRELCTMIKAYLKSREEEK